MKQLQEMFEQIARDPKDLANMLGMLTLAIFWVYIGGCTSSCLKNDRIHKLEERIKRLER